MTSTNTTGPKLTAAMNELVALAVAVRSDWTDDQVTAALMDAKTCGMTWAQALTGMARLMVDLNAKPAELVPSGGVPPRTLRTRPAAPERHAGELATVRDACAEASARLRAAERGAP